MFGNKNEKKGFTLIELLATILIIAMVMGVVSVVVIQFIDKGKETVNKVSMSNIRDSAIDYVIEFKTSKESWYNENDSDNSYACTTINQLINKGFLKNNLIDVETNEPIDPNTTIKVTRDKNMVVSSEILINSIECDTSKPTLELTLDGDIYEYDDIAWYYDLDNTNVVISLTSSSLVDEYNFIFGSTKMGMEKNGDNCNSTWCEVRFFDLLLFDGESVFGGTDLEICATVKNVNDIYSDIVCLDDIDADFWDPEHPDLWADDNIGLDDWHKNSFNLLVSGGGESPSGIYYEYKINEEEYKEVNSNKISVENNGLYYYFRACNNVGRCSGDVEHFFKIDNTPPTIVGFSKNTYDNAKSLTLTAKFVDYDSGIKKWKISTESSYVDSDWNEVSVTNEIVEITKEINKNNTYYLWVEDDAGNYDYRKMNINNIDNEGPVYYWGGVVTKGNITEAIFTDSSNPITVYYLVKYVKDTPIENEFNSTSRTFSYSCGNTYYAYAKAVDSLGNYTIKELGSVSGGICCSEYTDNLTALGLRDLLKSGKPNFSEIATTDEGIYATDDDLGTSYYFRGASTRNYVYFANFYWRIIRINGDGSIRLILNNNIGNSSYGKTNTYGFSYSDPLRDTVNNWYVTTSLVDESYSKYITTSKFCNDKTLYRDIIIDIDNDHWVDYYAAYYGADVRITQAKEPSLKCNNISDVYNLDVGIITIDEVSFAGGVYNKVNEHYYLYDKLGFWSMSAHKQDLLCGMGGCVDLSLIFYTTSQGAISSLSRINITGTGIRPVISLKKDTIFTGTGTKNDPFIPSDICVK